MNDLISVIVPVYNVEKYLRKCVESIVNQTYTNLEIILVNDGSSDSSALICDMVAEEDSRIKVIHQKNGGLSAARNAGLNISNGKYVSFIDSDDYLEAVFYEMLFRLMRKYNSDIVQCNFKRVYESDTKDINALQRSHDAPVFVLNSREALYNLFNENYVQTVISCNKLYKKELFNNIRFPIGKLHEDEFTTYKLLYASKKTVVTTEELYCYLQRSGSITQSDFSHKRLDAIEAYSEQISFYEEKELQEMKKKASIWLENILRRYMNSLLKSNLINKEELFDYLQKKYKDNFHLFKNAVRKNNAKYIIIHIIKYSPKSVLKSFLKLKNY
ncbi:glycosyltransferase [Exiguobacterium sp. s56]|uniref:glycosyltransferase n=1 Tax=Exiguobacterium sp. s56 TaxID=2751232 RepID=UPI001BE5C2F5|nr:glycosyltransferase [Exiguobacterium sp. s56]